MGLRGLGALGCAGWLAVPSWVGLPKLGCLGRHSYVFGCATHPDFSYALNLNVLQNPGLRGLGLLGCAGRLAVPSWVGLPRPGCLGRHSYVFGYATHLNFSWRQT